MAGAVVSGMTEDVVGLAGAEVTGGEVGTLEEEGKGLAEVEGWGGGGDVGTGIDVKISTTSKTEPASTEQTRQIFKTTRVDT